jgi:apolipoprotein N-acyltransferase
VSSENAPRDQGNVEEDAMSIGLLFWVLMVLWIVSWIGTRWGPYTTYVYASEFLFFVLLFLLGWHSFGFIIHA